MCFCVLANTFNYVLCATYVTNGKNNVRVGNWLAVFCCPIENMANLADQNGQPHVEIDQKMANGQLHCVMV